MSLERAYIPKSEDEPKPSKIKSISPHFNNTSFKVLANRPSFSTKQLTSNFKASFEQRLPANINIGGIHSGCSLANRFSDDRTQAASIQSYSQQFIAFNKFKRINHLDVRRQPADDDIFKVSSRTSLCDSLDGKAEMLPESVPLGPKLTNLRKTESHNPELRGIFSRSEMQNLTLNNFSPKKVPIMVLPQQQLEFNPGLPSDYWLDDEGKNAPIKVASHFDIPSIILNIPEKVRKSAKKPTTIIDFLGNVPSQWNHGEKKICLPSISPIRSLSSVIQHADHKMIESSPIQVNRNQKVKIQKSANVVGGDHLLNLVKPDDGFDLDILSIVDMQACASIRHDIRQATRMFDFEDCSIMSPKPTIARRSMDGMSMRKHADIDAYDSNINQPSNHRTKVKRATVSSKPQSTQPLVIRFDRLKEINRDMRASSKKQAHKSQPPELTHSYAMLIDL